MESDKTQKSARIYQADIKAVAQWIQNTLLSQWDEASVAWVQDQYDHILHNGIDRKLFLAFGMAPRKVGKSSISLPEELLSEADQLRSKWTPQNWTADQWVRTYFLLALAQHPVETFEAGLNDLFDGAEMNELVALYGALPLYPDPISHALRAAEGIRTNMSLVFDAVALDNPYPTDYMSQAAWNQMYLKAAFMTRPMYRIQGVLERANEELARIILDYAHERWSAGRKVIPEIWRAIPAFIKTENLKDIERLFLDTDPLQQQAASLVCYESQDIHAKELYQKYTQWHNAIKKGDLTWRHIGESLLNS